MQVHTRTYTHGHIDREGDVSKRGRRKRERLRETGRK